MLRLFTKIFNLIRQHLFTLYVVAGAFVVAFCLCWINIDHQPHWRWFAITIGVWCAVFIFYQLIKFLYSRLVRRRQLSVFWQSEFARCLDELFLISSLALFTIFIRYKIDAILLGLLIWCLFFNRLHQYFAKHTFSQVWQNINLTIFTLSGFVFLLASITQFAAREYYILDAAIRPAFVSLRAFAITMLWLLGFSVSGLVILRYQKWHRYVLLVLWSMFFLGGLFLSFTNLGILYFSGLYFSPIAWQHAGGGMGVAINWLTIILAVGFVLSLGIFIILIHRFARTLVAAPKRYWRFYLRLIVISAALSLLATSAFKTTPEFAIAKSFYDYYFKAQAEVELSPIIQEKLKRFGLNYNLEQFYLAHKERVFSEPNKIISSKFETQKPNIIIFFLESFSARLTDIYNSGFTNLTPGLDMMAADKNTTVFHKYYNASTPTITGTLSILCSFLPPTGHQEIEIQKKLQRTRLLCLPEILKRNGYQYSEYITAIGKDFANKGTLLPSIGVDVVTGQDELKKLVTGEPLAWGYSDHQMLPVLWDKIQTQKQPFLYMLATVDTHPPFNKAKDRVRYNAYNSDALDMFHTTDDAFRQFWEKFKQSSFASNTIVIAVGDHAVFPAMYNSVKIPGYPGWLDFYDQITFMMYVPDSLLPKEVDMYSSSLDVTPSLLQVLNINTPNAFEGHSLFDPRGRKQYPNILGMHEFGLYVNQVVSSTKRTESYNLPDNIKCTPADYTTTSTAPLTLCEYLDFYHWKRQMFEQGRFWGK